MDGQAFAMDYQPVADIYSTGVHEIASARSTRDPSSNIALFTCSYGGFDESDRATLRRRTGEYCEFNNSSTAVQPDLLSPYLARLSHYFNDDASALLTMGLPYGVNTLYDVMMAKAQSYSNFTEEEVWRVVAALCDAARFMHSEEKPDTELEEFAHLGIHPANIFLYADGARIRLGYPYICPTMSFKNPGNYRAFQQLGEAHFMAPEFIEAGAKGSCPCDIFSIGMVGYAMMTNSTAWSASNINDLQGEVYTRGAISLPYDGRYSQDLVDLVNSMLSFDSSARPKAEQLCASGKIAQCIAENGDAPTMAPPKMTRDIVQPPSGLTDLIIAARDGDLSGVRNNLHQAGSTDQCGRTALMYAAEHGYADCVRAIVSDAMGHGEVRLQDKYMWTATMYAAQNGHADCVSLLHEEFGMQRRDGATALFTAVFWNRCGCVKVLAPTEAIISTNDRYWQGERYTAAMEAARWGRPECLQELLGHIDRYTTDNNGNDVAYYAMHPWEHVSADKSSRVREVLNL